MVVDVSIAIIAGTMVVLTVLLLFGLFEAKKSLKSTKKDLHQAVTEAIEMMKKIETLTSDIKAKADSLNFIFRPLKSLNKERHETDTVTEVVEWVTTSLILFNKIKAAVKDHEK